MADNTNRNWAERWVLRVGKLSFIFGKKGTLIPFIAAAICMCGLLFVFFFAFHENKNDTLEGAILGVGLAGGTISSAFAGIVYFERRYFYKIIKEQEEKIEQLEKEPQGKR